MTSSSSTVRLLSGEAPAFDQARAAFSDLPVDLDLTGEPPVPYAAGETTLARPVTVQGPGTFLRRATRTLTLEPCEEAGWWFERGDRPEDLPTLGSVRNVWTTGQAVSNIVLRSGEPHNYVRMVEHIIALRLGLGLDRVRVRLDSGDPPIFDRGSLDLVEAVDSAGLVETGRPVRWVTVREPVGIVSPGGAFLVLRPCAGPAPRLRLDVGIDFPTVIGRQRLILDLDAVRFRAGVVARTNTSAGKKVYCQTLGRLFADIRNLGYTKHNVLVAGRTRYHNEPRLLHNGKSLEAVWHRAVLDLLAALALIEGGRFVGEVTSFKAGHRLDVRMITLCTKAGLFVPYAVA
jgi:UDP-3-O-acyl-N-acetylglucosamine deacetylase